MTYPVIYTHLYEYSKYPEGFIPAIQVLLISKSTHKYAQTDALIDTGAAYPLFNSDFVKPLRLGNPSRYERIITAGSPIKVAIYPLALRVNPFPMAVKCDIGFVPGLKFSLLGRIGVLDHFLFGLDESEHKFYMALKSE